MILRQLLKDIFAADYFAVIADEATDISHNEQMCIAIRWVDVPTISMKKHLV